MAERKLVATATYPCCSQPTHLESDSFPPDPPPVGAYCGTPGALVTKKHAFKFIQRRLLFILVSIPQQAWEVRDLQ